MRPGVTLEAVEARMRAVWPRLLEAVRPPGLTGVHLENYRRRQLRVAEGGRGVDEILRPRFERPLIALLAVSGIVLLLVCVNLASLLLARGAAQRGEWLVQLALGAPRSVLVRGVLAEGGLVLALGAVGGVALAFWISRLLVMIYGESMVEFAIDVVPDLRIVGFAVATSALVLLAFAIGPAWSASRLSVASLNAESSRLVPSRGRVRAGAIVVQIALAIVLVSAGALCITTLREMKTVPLGMTVEGIAGAQLAGRSGGYQNGFSGTPYYQDLLRRIKSIARRAPVGAEPAIRPVRIQFRHPRVPSGRGWRARERRRVRQRRLLCHAGDPDADRNAVRARSPAHRCADCHRQRIAGAWAVRRESPLGRLVRIGLDPQEAPARIVAVVRDAIVVSPQQRNTRVAYLNYWQLEPARQGFPSLLARVDGQTGPVMQAIERTVRDAGREFVLKAAMLEEVRDGSLAQERLLASLTTAFAVVGLVLVAVGVYGLLAFSVVQRTPEIGLRVALGGTPRAVVWLVVRDTMYLVLGGIAIGVPAGVLATQTLGSLVFTAPPGSGRHAATAVAVLLGFCLAAVWLPSRRASRIERPTRSGGHDRDGRDQGPATRARERPRSSPSTHVPVSRAASVSRTLGSSTPIWRKWRSNSRGFSSVGASEASTAWRSSWARIAVSRKMS